MILDPFFKSWMIVGRDDTGWAMGFTIDREEEREGVSLIYSKNYRMARRFETMLGEIIAPQEYSHVMPTGIVYPEFSFVKGDDYISVVLNRDFTTALLEWFFRFDVRRIIHLFGLTNWLDEDDFLSSSSDPVVSRRVGKLGAQTVLGNAPKKCLYRWRG